MVRAFKTIGQQVRFWYLSDALILCYVGPRVEHRWNSHLLFSSQRNMIREYKLIEIMNGQVDQRTCSPGSSRAASLSVSKTLLTVSHLIVKNDVTPIPNLVIKRTNTAYMSYLKNVTAKQDNFLAYLRKTEKYKLNNNGFTAKTRSIDDISVKGNQQNATTQVSS